MCGGHPLVPVGTRPPPVRTLSLSAGANGSISADTLSGHDGDIVTLSNTPSAHYHFSSYAITGATLTGNKFAFDGSDVTAAAAFDIDKDKVSLYNGAGKTMRAMSYYSGGALSDSTDVLPGASGEIQVPGGGYVRVSGERYSARHMEFRSTGISGVSSGWVNDIPGTFSTGRYSGAGARISATTAQNIFYVSAAFTSISAQKTFTPGTNRLGVVAQLKLYGGSYPASLAWGAGYWPSAVSGNLSARYSVSAKYAGNVNGNSYLSVASSYYGLYGTYESVMDSGNTATPWKRTNLTATATPLPSGTYFTYTLVGKPYPTTATATATLSVSATMSASGLFA